MGVAACNEFELIIKHLNCNYLTIPGMPVYPHHCLLTYVSPIEILTVIALLFGRQSSGTRYWRGGLLPKSKYGGSVF